MSSMLLNWITFNRTIVELKYTNTSIIGAIKDF